MALRENILSKIEQECKELIMTVKMIGMCFNNEETIYANKSIGERICTRKIYQH